MPPERLLTTGQAARLVGVAPRTLAQWAADGWVRPTLHTAGGHARWELEDLRKQLQDRRQRGEE